MANGTVGREAHKVTPEMQAEVKALASYGVTQEDIATYVGVSESTIKKYYKRELETGGIYATSLVAARLFQHATGDSVSAAIFWMKTRGGWRTADNTSTEEGLTSTADALMELAKKLPC